MNNNLKFNNFVFNSIILKAKEYMQTTSLNPNVGSAIVVADKIISIEAHKKYGTNHAEVNAIQQAQKKIGSLQNASIYITLEPCSTYGKTPPCTQAIINSGIKNVFIGILDPNPKHAGRAVKILKDNDINVHVGFKQKQCAKLIADFYKSNIHHMPLISSKIAQCLSGKIACLNGDSKWISNKKSREYVQKIRSKHDSIITGINTVLADNPNLNIRSNKINFSDQPARIILDSNLKMPLKCNIVDSIKQQKTYIITKQHNSQKAKKLSNLGFKIIDFNPHNTNQIPALLHQLNFKNTLIESGAKVNTSFLKNNLIDYVNIFVAPMFLGSDSLPSILNLNYIKVNQANKFKLLKTKKFDDDIYLKYSNNDYTQQILNYTKQMKA